MHFLSPNVFYNLIFEFFFIEPSEFFSLFRIIERNHGSASLERKQEREEQKNMMMTKERNKDNIEYDLDEKEIRSKVS